MHTQQPMEDNLKQLHFYFAVESSNVKSDSCYSVLSYVSLFLVPSVEWKFQMFHVHHDLFRKSVPIALCHTLLLYYHTNFYCDISKIVFCSCTN